MSADLPGGACPVAGVRTEEVIGSGRLSDDVRGPLLLLMSEIAASSGCRGLLMGGGSGTGLSTTIATDATFGWEYSPRLAASVRISFSRSLCWMLWVTPGEGVRSSPSVYRSPLL